MDSRYIYILTLIFALCPARTIRWVFRLYPSHGILHNIRCQADKDDHDFIKINLNVNFQVELLNLTSCVVSPMQLDGQADMQIDRERCREQRDRGRSENISRAVLNETIIQYSTLSN